MSRPTCSHVVVIAQIGGNIAPSSNGRIVVRCERCKRYRWETAEEAAARQAKGVRP